MNQKSMKHVQNREKTALLYIYIYKHIIMYCDKHAKHRHEHDFCQEVWQAFAEYQQDVTSTSQHSRHLLCICGTVMEDFLIFAILVVTYSGVWACTSMPLEANSAAKPMENLQGSLSK